MNMEQCKNFDSWRKPSGLGLVALVAGLLLGGVVADIAAADVIAVGAYTDDGDGNVTSVTIDGTVYSELIGSTIASTDIALDPHLPNLVGFWLPGTPPLPDPTLDTIADAASGLNYQSGAVNIRGPGSIFQFGRTIGAQDRAFIWDLGAGDTVELRLVDGNGDAIGDYTLSLQATDFGATSLVEWDAATPVIRGEGIVGGVFIQEMRAVSFQLSDFVGTTGDLGQATGIEIVTPTSGLDPAIVGLAVPEPGSLGLLGVSGLLFLLGWGRTASHDNSN